MEDFERCRGSSSSHAHRVRVGHPPPVVGHRDDEHHHLRIAPAHLLHFHRSTDRVGNPFVPDHRSCLGLDCFFLVMLCDCLYINLIYFQVLVRIVMKPGFNT